MSIQQKAADTAPVLGWTGWILSHLTQINELAQFFLLITSIAATLVAMRYHWRKTPKQ